ncbi:hypothetical protein PFISCL1PPCAC_11582, partial [Pristionchus fissidentatus]
GLYSSSSFFFFLSPDFLFLFSFLFLSSSSFFFASGSGKKVDRFDSEGSPPSSYISTPGPISTASLSWGSKIISVGLGSLVSFSQSWICSPWYLVFRRSGPLNPMSLAGMRKGFSPMLSLFTFCN